MKQFFLAIKCNYANMLGMFTLWDFSQCKFGGTALLLVWKFMRWARSAWLGSWLKFAMRLLVYGFVCRLLSPSNNLAFAISVGRLKMAKKSRPNSSRCLARWQLDILFESNVLKMKANRLYRLCYALRALCLVRTSYFPNYMSTQQKCIYYKCQVFGLYKLAYQLSEVCEISDQLSETMWAIRQN